MIIVTAKNHRLAAFFLKAVNYYISTTDIRSLPPASPVFTNFGADFHCFSIRYNSFQFSLLLALKATLLTKQIIEHQLGENVLIFYELVLKNSFIKLISSIFSRNYQTIGGLSLQETAEAIKSSPLRLPELMDETIGSTQRSYLSLPTLYV